MCVRRVRCSTISVILIDMMHWLIREYGMCVSMSEGKSFRTPGEQKAHIQRVYKFVWRQSDLQKAESTHIRTHTHTHTHSHLCRHTYKINSLSPCDVQNWWFLTQLRHTHMTSSAFLFVFSCETCDGTAPAKDIIL